MTKFVHARALTLLDVVKTAGKGAEAGFNLAEGFRRARTRLLLEFAQATVALAQLLGDVVDTAPPGAAFLIVTFQPTDNARNGLIHTLDGHG